MAGDEVNMNKTVKTVLRRKDMKTVLGMLVLVLMSCLVVVSRGRTDSGVKENNRFVLNNKIHKIYWRTSLGEREKREVRGGSKFLRALKSTEGKRGRELPEDVFIAVKTTKKFHKSRLDVILKTWFQLVKQQTWFFTDSPDSDLSALTSNHLIPSSCPSDHSRSALCCKMANELETFLATNNSWFCHVDDDNYVNVAALADTLSHYDKDQEHYLGKASIPEPLEILDREAPKKKINFWFGTGGAGFCISRPLAERMATLVKDGEFVKIGNKIRLPDDVTVGYIVEVLLNVPLTHVSQFHSHLEPLKTIKPDQFKDQITFSYSQYENTGERNIIHMDGLSLERDPTRFLSLHCKLYPSEAEYCDSFRKN